MKSNHIRLGVIIVFEIYWKTSIKYLQIDFSVNLQYCTKVQMRILLIIFACSSFDTGRMHSLYQVFLFLISKWIKPYFSSLLCDILSKCDDEVRMDNSSDCNLTPFLRKWLNNTKGNERILFYFAIMFMHPNMLLSSCLHVYLRCRWRPSPCRVRKVVKISLLICFQYLMLQRLAQVWWLFHILYGSIKWKQS